MTEIFFKHLCSRANLFAAWRHVRTKALQSDSLAIKDAAKDFDFHAFTNIQSIQSLLSKETFEFPPAEGILKDKRKREQQGKLPRPIVLADIRSRIVQRALLQCLQPNSDSALFPLLGTISDINLSKTNFGGTPSGGVQRAIHRANTLITKGYCLYYKSDIGSFFTKVPQAHVVEFVKCQIGDERFARVFDNGLSVQLKNENQLKQYLSLFPENGIGVPQGSSLSAFAGNIFLHDVDILFHEIDDVFLVRYVDDVLLLANSNDRLQRSKELLAKHIREKGLNLYSPESAPDKAATGHVRGGLEYLGCTLRINHIEPSKRARASLISKVERIIGGAKNAITEVAASKPPKRKDELAFVQSIVEIDSVIRGWANSFKFVNNRLPFKQLDAGISVIVRDYRRWMNNFNFSDATAKNRGFGIYQTSDVEYKSLDDYVQIRVKRIPAPLTKQGQGTRNKASGSKAVDARAVQVGRAAYSSEPSPAPTSPPPPLSPPDRSA